MKLAIFAAFFSVTLTASQAAQTTPDAPPAPPHAGMHLDGPRGAHGPMMFGRGGGAHRVEPIPNGPFTAHFTETANFTDRQGKQEQRSSTSIVYRDSQGRVREEVTLPAPPPRTPTATAPGTTPTAPATPRGPRTVITILDPVAHTITHLNPEQQTAYVENVPVDFFTRMQQRDERLASGQQPQHSRDNATTTDLGNKVFAGVSGKGTQTSVSFPARDGGAAQTMTRQNWFSPDLKLEVSSSETTDRGTRSDTLTSLDKAEPNPGLFQVPAGYTTVNAPDRQFPGRHHGGFGGPAGQDAPPPPPSM